MKNGYNSVILRVLLFVYGVRGTASCQTYDKDPSVVTFQEAMESPYFVDKTMLLKDLLKHQPAIITCPKKFGKTTNIDMAVQFFQLHIDKRSKERVDKKLTPYYQLFANKSSNLEISQNKRFVEKHSSEYPVLQLDFSNIQGVSTEQIMNSIFARIIQLLRPYQWLYKRILAEYERNNDDMLEMYLENWELVNEETCTAYNIIDSIQDLAEILEKRYRNKVMVLIDNYDTPTVHAIKNGADAVHVETFMQRLWSAFVNNRRARCVVMMVGVSRSFTGMNNSEVVSTYRQNCFLESTNHLGKYFGFSDTEVDYVLSSKYVDDEERYRIRRYFNGYTSQLHCNRNQSDDKELSSLYNPSAVLHYLKTKNFEYIQPTTPLIPKLMKCLIHREFFDEISKILKKQHTTAYDHIGTHVSPNDLQAFVEISKSDCTTFKPNSRFLSPFVDNGYLVRPSQPNQTISLANKIITKQLRHQFQDFYLQKYHINVSDSNVVANLRAILNSRNTTFEMLSGLASSLEQLLTTKLSYSTYSEFEFQSIVFAIVHCYLKFYEIVRIKIVGQSAECTSVTHQPLPVLKVPTYKRKILLVIKVTAATKLADSIREIRDYVPLESSETSIFNLVKYLAINLNDKNRVDVAKGKNRPKW